MAWLSTVDHKRIGILYLVTALVFFVIDGIEEMLIRLYRSSPCRTTPSCIIHGRSVVGKIAWSNTLTTSRRGKC